jgi:hypothetical protein
MGVKTMLDYTPEKHSYVPAPPTVSSIHVFPRPLPQPRYTRIDFFQINVGIALGLREIKWGWRVSKYIDGWTANTPPHIVADDPPMKSTDGTDEPFNIDKALTHLAAHGWTVHRWQSGLSAGARAWLGSPLPVRNRAQINRMRSALTRHLIATQGHTAISTQVDLAFDY